MNRKRILLFEDDVGQTLLTKELLEKEQYLVDTAPNGAMGLELFSKNPYDFVLLDLVMPDMTGTEVFKKLKERSPDILGIMVTGSGDELSAVEALKSGVSDYIVKASNGAHLATLPLVIEHSLERQRLKRERKEYAATLEKRVAERTSELEQSRNALEKTLEETRRLETNLIQSEKMGALGQLAGGVAHELNSPLAGIIELLRLFTRRSGNSESDQKLFVAMKDAAEHAATIVKDLRVFARPARGEPEPVSVNELIEKTLSFSAHDFRVKGIGIIKKLSPEVRSVMADGSQLQQVFLNMITNARDAMAGKKEGDKELLIETNTNNQTVEVRFSDNGEGIPEEILGKIFDPFFTTKGIGKGTGLGLSISHGIVEKHGGKIDVVSEVGKRTTFTIRLPAVSP